MATLSEGNTINTRISTEQNLSRLNLENGPQSSQQEIDTQAAIDFVNSKQKDLQDQLAEQQAIVQQITSQQNLSDAAKSDALKNVYYTINRLNESLSRIADASSAASSGVSKSEIQDFLTAVDKNAAENIIQSKINESRNLAAQNFSINQQNIPSQKLSPQQAESKVSSLQPVRDAQGNLISFDDSARMISRPATAQEKAADVFVRNNPDRFTAVQDSSGKIISYLDAQNRIEVPIQNISKAIQKEQSQTKSQIKEGGALIVTPQEADKLHSSGYDRPFYTIQAQNYDQAIIEGKIIAGLNLSQKNSSGQISRVNNNPSETIEEAIFTGDFFNSPANRATLSRPQVEANAENILLAQEQARLAFAEDTFNKKLIEIQNQFNKDYSEGGTYSAFSNQKGFKQEKNAEGISYSIGEDFIKNLPEYQDYEKKYNEYSKKFDKNGFLNSDAQSSLQKQAEDYYNSLPLNSRILGTTKEIGESLSRNAAGIIDFPIQIAGRGINAARAEAISLRDKGKLTSTEELLNEISNPIEIPIISEAAKIPTGKTSYHYNSNPVKSILENPSKDIDVLTQGTLLAEGGVDIVSGLGKGLSNIAAEGLIGGTKKSALDILKRLDLVENRFQSPTVELVGNDLLINGKKDILFARSLSEEVEPGVINRRTTASNVNSSFTFGGKPEEIPESRRITFGKKQIQAPPIDIDVRSILRDIEDQQKSVNVMSIKKPIYDVKLNKRVGTEETFFAQLSTAVKRGIARRGFVNADIDIQNEAGFGSESKSITKKVFTVKQFEKDNVPQTEIILERLNNPSTETKSAGSSEKVTEDITSFRAGKRNLGFKNEPFENNYQVPVSKNTLAISKNKKTAQELLDQISKDYSKFSKKKNIINSEYLSEGFIRQPSKIRTKPFIYGFEKQLPSRVSNNEDIVAALEEQARPQSSAKKANQKQIQNPADAIIEFETKKANQKQIQNPAQDIVAVLEEQSRPQSSTKNNQPSTIVLTRQREKNIQKSTQQFENQFQPQESKQKTNQKFTPLNFEDLVQQPKNKQDESLSQTFVQLQKFQQVEQQKEKLRELNQQISQNQNTNIPEINTPGLDGFGFPFPPGSSQGGSLGSENKQERRGRKKSKSEYTSSLGAAVFQDTPLKVSKKQYDQLASTIFSGAETRPVLAIQNTLQKKRGRPKKIQAGNAFKIPKQKKQTDKYDLQDMFDIF